MKRNLPPIFSWAPTPRFSRKRSRESFVTTGKGQSVLREGGDRVDGLVGGVGVAVKGLEGSGGERSPASWGFIDDAEPSPTRSG